MNKRRKSINPFYVPLILVGVMFVVSAAAYGVMTVRDARPTAAGAAPRSELMSLMRRRGGTILLLELAALGALTVAAIGTDGHWQRRYAARQANAKEPQ